MRPSVNRDPTVWGPGVWSTMHTIAAAYPEAPNHNERRAADDFFASLQHLLPCVACREHYAEAIARSPPKLGSGTELFEWTRQLHNEVNARLGKPVLTQKQAIEATRANARHPSSTTFALKLTIGALGVLLIAALVALDNERKKRHRE